MLRVIDGAFFAAAVIVAEDVVGLQIIGVDQPSQQPDQGIVGFLSELSVVRLIATFDRDGILVTCLHRVSDLIQRNTLNDLPVIPDDEMRTGTALMIVLKLFEIAAVLCRTGAGVGSIMHENIIHLRQRISRSGIFIDRKEILRPVRMRCVSLL